MDLQIRDKTHNNINHKYSGIFAVSCWFLRSDLYNLRFVFCLAVVLWTFPIRRLGTASAWLSRHVAATSCHALRSGGCALCESDPTGQLGAERGHFGRGRKTTAQSNRREKDGEGDRHGEGAVF